MMVPRNYLRPAMPETRRGRRSPMNSRSPSPMNSRSPSPKPRPPLKIIKDLSTQSQPVISSQGPTSEPRPIVQAERATTEPFRLPSSQPMIIPPRKASVEAQNIKIVHGRRGSKRPEDVLDPHALPPAVVALLAVTEIPPPKGRTIRKKRPIPTRVSIEHLRKEWEKDASKPSSLSKASPLDFLLQPAEEQPEDEDLAVDEAERESRSLSSRSVSSASIRSIPSLDAGESFSTWSSPVTPTPSLLRRPPRTDRRDRTVSSPPAEECPNHPLLEIPSSEPYIPDPPRSTASTSVRPRAEKQRSSFKSNLTASFQALRSAAKSFSNFSAPSIPVYQDDLLTRSLFFTRGYASEMRPKGFTGVPDPILRRYLNPTPALSSPDFSNQLQDALGGFGTRDAPHLDGQASPMIQLQPFSSRKKRRAASAPPASERVISEFPSTTRQREPRENSDFLRVIVLEMNMRRVGKLDAKAGGRARVWLPPRKSGEVVVAVVAGGGAKSVPGRWIGISAEDMDDK